MKKMSLLIFSLLLLVFVSANIVYAGPIVIKSTHDSPAGSVTDNVFNFMANQLEERSGGKFKVDVYPAVSLSNGNIKLMIQQVEDNFIQMGGIGSSIYDSFQKDARIFQLPFLFNTFDEIYELGKSEVGQIILENMKQNNLVGLALWPHGFREPVTNKPVHTPKDVEGLRIRVPETPVLTRAWVELGAIPTPMPFSEAPIAVQTGAIDAVERPYTFIYSEKWYDLCKYIIELNYASDVNMIAFSKDFWDKLSQEDQDLIKQIVAEAEEMYLVDYQNEIISNKAELQEKGMTVIEFTSDELEAFRTATRPARDSFIEDIGVDLYNQAIQFLESLRK